MDDAVIGKEVDGYHIESILGRGGMGVVYKGEDVALSRPVALKRINPAQAHREQFLRRFRAEAKALARINSPYITSIYALRDTDIGLLIVMEYVDGGTLKDRIVEGPMTPAEAVPIVQQILRSFRDAHGAGVIHRDIKPQNIMLTSDGDVKITDFGIAKLRRRDSGETVTQGGQGGTLKYMSPEQIEKIDEVDNRSDLYALGMTMYEMLAGRLPFDELDTDFDIMRKVVEGDVPPAGDFVPNLPAPLATVIERATEQKADDRYPSADAMLEALDEAAERIDDTSPSAMWDVAESDAPEQTQSQDTDADTAADTADGDPTADTSPADDTSEADDGTILDDSLLDEIDGGATQPPAKASGGPAPTKQHAPSASDHRGRDGTTDKGVPVGVVAAIVVAMLAVAGGGYVFFQPSSTAMSTLTLQTKPGSAVIEIADDSVGVTPLANHQLPAGTHRLKIRKSGFQPIDTSVTVKEGQTLVLSGFELRPQPVQFAVSSAPSGARVLVGSSEIGTTPIQGATVEAGKARVLLEKGGYTSFDTTITFEPGSQVTLAGLQLDRADEASTRSTRAPAESAPSRQPAASGRISVTAPSQVTVWVDGEERTGGGTFRLASGTRTVRCLHPRYQTIERQVNVSQNDTVSISCVYQHVISVNSLASWGNIYIDGVNSKISTPGEKSLPPGTYRVEIRKEREDDFRIQGGTYRLTPAQGGENKARRTFETSYYDVEIEPAFQKYKHYITFSPES
ncbi:hypothetical protein CRI94_04765 [Longibacter salinarum]|uniref:Protein kinase domain-containing protein n=1 Tax=Longibacter salinarum TaxID=1850348 RepID=A0A2A8D0F4_9BACT|nr:serine/threonine-protein kinase [Longibacter salinarum]PEN14350.1 hypothetical protein CRI94_04765 [Longibacter salinarum]